jgi:tRNA(Phe) wybutosine-synthesizing methylase Tyw3
VREEVHSEVSAQFDNFVRTEFKSFIDDNFTPAIERIDQRFDRLEDRVDRLAGNVAELRVDTRHLKQAFHAHGFNPAAG